MTSTVSITAAMIRKHINRAVTDVFRTMLGRRAILCAPADPAARESLSFSAPRAQIAGTVGFVGELQGQVYLRFDLGFAQICVGHLLGLNQTELARAGDEVVDDAIGELTNMTVGCFKTGLSDLGYPCMMTSPSILRGNHFSVAPVSSVVHHVIDFDCAEHRVAAEILLKLDD